MVSNLSQVDGGEELVLLNMVEHLFSTKIKTTLFFDDGSTCSIITFKLAKQLGLKGTKVKQWLETAGRKVEEWNTEVF